MENKKEEYYTIDVMRILKNLWHRAWLIALVGLIFAFGGFSVARFAIAPTYSSSVMLYVNNNTSSSGTNPIFSMSSSQISAAQQLVKTYGEILNNRTTLERIITKTGVEYDYKELAGMIKAAPSNDTEIMKVTVVSEDADEAALIANAVCEVLPERIAEIIDGATMEVVEHAIPEYKKIGPSVTKYTAVGMILGLLAAGGLMVLWTILDDRIHDEEYILQNYDMPILAKIPDLMHAQGKRYGYYYLRENAGKGKRG